jgi:hypothetical protein
VGAAQLFDDAEAHPAAAVHRHTGGLVDDQQVLVLEQHREFARRHRRLGRRVSRAGRGHPHWRHAHHITQFQPGVGGGTTLVHPHLASADDAVHMGLGHALELAQQEVVQALACRAVVDRHQPHLRRSRGGDGRLARHQDGRTRDGRGAGRGFWRRRPPGCGRPVFRLYNGLSHD